MRLGARLLQERVQVRDLNVSAAAKAAGINAGTLNRIERGKNYEIDKLEKYALSLGRPLESWLREVLAVPDDLLDQIAAWSQKQQPGRKVKGA